MMYGFNNVSLWMLGLVLGCGLWCGDVLGDEKAGDGVEKAEVAEGEKGKVVEGGAVEGKKGELLGEIKWVRGMEKGIALAQESKRPIAIYFSAQWCGWCRKMSTGTFRESAVLKYAKDYVWVKVDLDDEAAVANEYKIQSIPQVTICNKDGEVLKALPGYYPAAGLAEMLEVYKNGADMKTDADAAVDQVMKAVRVLSNPKSSGELVSKVVHDSVGALSRPGYTGKKELRALLLKNGDICVEELLQLMRHEQLAVRAVAGELVMEMTKSGIGFDPFLPGEKRLGQVKSIERWLAEHPLKGVDRSGFVPGKEVEVQPKDEEVEPKRSGGKKVVL